MVVLFKQLISSGSVVGLFFQVVPITCMAGVIYAVCRWRKIKKYSLNITPGKELVRLLFVCYLTGLINLVLVPNNFWGYVWFYVFNGYPGGTLEPLFSGSFNLSSTLLALIGGDYVSGSWIRTMLVGNLLMFVPMGIFLPRVFDKLNIKKLLCLAIMIPVGVEILQPVVGRSFDIDDLLLNFIGIMIGLAIERGFKYVTGK